MFKWLIGLLCTLFVFIIPSFAQQPANSPTIYRAVNRSFLPGRGGVLSIIDALTMQEIQQINLETDGDFVEVTKDKRAAFVKPFVREGLFVVDLLQGTSRKILPSFFVFSVKEAPDGFVWAVLGSNNMISIINPQTLGQTSIISNLDKPRDVAFSPDGTRAYISLENSNIVVFDTQRRSVISTITNLPPSSKDTFRPMELAVSPDGNLLALASPTTITIIDTNSFQIVDRVPFQTTTMFGIVQILFNTDGTKLYIGEENQLNLFEYELMSKQLTKIFTASRFTIQGFKLSSDGGLLYISEFSGKSVIDTKTQATIFSIIDFPGTGDPVSLGIDIAGNFTIGQPPTIQVTSPMANQQIMPGQSFRIQWQTTVAAQSFSIASHKVELSTDGGMTFTVIPGAEQLRADARDFNWTVPNIQVANKAQIRVSTVDLGAKRANSITGNFTIGMGGGGNNDTQAPTVNFIAPTGGENFNSGSNLSISWMSSDNVGVAAQDLSLSTDGGASFTTTIATGLPGSTQSFNFAIPQTLETNQARLRLIVRDGAGNMAQAITANNFNIQSAVDNIAPTVTISQPTTNQQVMAGQPIQVNWQSIDNRAVISQSLLLSLNGGQSFTQVASFGATDSSFILNNINNLSLTTPQAIVRIIATDAAGNTGQANAQFTINPTITQTAFQAKILTLNGIGFMSNGANNLQLFINDKLITIAPRSVTNTTFTIKGNKKKLNLIKGSSNSVRLVVDGISSNMGSFMF